MFFPGESRPHRLIVLLLALACSGGLLALLALWIAPGPAAIEASQDSARVAFQADRRFVNWPGDCLSLRWEASGIQALYLNGEGQAGQGTAPVCLQANVVQRLEVVFADGSRQVYLLQTGILLWQAEFWLLLGVAAVGLLLAGRFSFGPLRRHPRLSGWIILLGGALTLSLTLAILVLHPRPTAAALTAGEARISLVTDRDWVLKPHDCVTLTWALDNIRAVYLNEQGVPGAGAESFCLDQGQPSLRVLLTDGSEIVTGLTIYVLLDLPGYGLLAAGGLLLSGLAALLGFAWARRAFARAAQPVRTPAGRRGLVQLGLVAWMVAVLFVYWVMAGAPGFLELRGVYTHLLRLLLQIFSAPTRAKGST